jgi:hypothetical protein
VRELRFHRTLYRGESVDAAIRTFERYGRLERREEPDYWVVAIAAKSARRERRIADELANFALGLTIRERQQEGV